MPDKQDALTSRDEVSQASPSNPYRRWESGFDVPTSRFCFVADGAVWIGLPRSARSGSPAGVTSLGVARYPFESGAEGAGGWAATPDASGP